MKTAKQIFLDARNSARKVGDVNYLNSDGTYNTEFTISHEQVHVAALLKIASDQKISFKQAAEKYYIDGISTAGENGERISITNDAFNNFFQPSINSAVLEAKKGKPSFLSVDDGHHLVLIAFVPDHRDHKKLNVVYVNSLPRSIEEYKDNPNTSTGKRLVHKITEYLNKTKTKRKLGITLASNEPLDESVDQQYDNCCGLSVASNIAAIVKHHEKGKPIETLNRSIFIPEDNEEKKRYYKAFGNEVFRVLDGREKTQEKSAPAPDRNLTITKIKQAKSYDQALEIYNEKLKSKDSKPYIFDSETDNKNGTKTIVWDSPNPALKGNKDYQITYIVAMNDEILSVNAGKNATAKIPPIRSSDNQNDFMAIKYVEGKAAFIKKPEVADPKIEYRVQENGKGIKLADLETNTSWLKKVKKENKKTETIRKSSNSRS